jgi:hypothetical protein
MLPGTAAVRSPAMSIDVRDTIGTQEVPRPRRSDDVAPERAARVALRRRSDYWDHLTASWRTRQG